MTEITRVPLQPISKGTLAKLWIGVALAVLLAAGLAFAAVPDGVEVTVLEEGEGPTAEMGDVVFIKYVGRLDDGTVFDESGVPPIPPGLFPEGVPFPLEEGSTIEGFAEGLQRMRAGGRYILEIPSDQAYGAEPPPDAPIPPNADLVFEMEVTGIMSGAEFEQRLMALQQMMQGMAGPGGAPGDPSAGAGAGPPPAPPVPLPGQ